VDAAVGKRGVGHGDDGWGGREMRGKICRSERFVGIDSGRG